MLQKLIATTLSIAIVGVMIAAFTSGNLGATLVAHGNSPSTGAIGQRPTVPVPAALDEAAALPQTPPTAEAAPAVSAPVAAAPVPKVTRPAPQTAVPAPQVARPEPEIDVPAPESVATAPAPEAA